jgi:hypothetical protein
MFTIMFFPHPEIPEANILFLFAVESVIAFVNKGI